jgi:hypothetical protein
MQRIAVSSLRLELIVVAAFAALVCSTPTIVRADPTAEAGRPEASEGLKNEQQERKEEQQEYIREHSDASGKMHPDAYVKGMEHVRHMKVAPYIGAKPLGEASPTSSK